MAKPPTSERGRQPASPGRGEAETRSLNGASHRGDRGGLSSLFLAASWRSIVASIVALLGLGVATYLTIAHYSPGALSCPLGSASHAINCLKVTTSPQSVVFGIPVAVLGLAFFVLILPLSLPFAWHSSSLNVARLRLLCAVSGIGFVFYLLYSELFTIKAICLWCTCVHVLTFVWFVLVVTGWDDETANVAI